MRVSTKVVGAVAGAGSVAGLLVAAGGIILVILSVTDKIPTSSCLSSGWGISQQLQDTFVLGQFIVGLPCLIAGMFAMVGGVVGAWAGFTGSKRGLSFTAWAEGIACTFAFVGALMAWKLAGRFGEMCNNFECSGTCSTHWKECNNANVCCDCNGHDGKTYAMCSSAHDWACACESRKTAGLLLAIVTCIFTLGVSVLASSATCFCEDYFKYAQMEPTEEPGEYDDEDEKMVVVGKTVDED